MNPERWERLKTIFEAVLEQDPPRRAAFLEDACGTDSALRNEVEALLAACQDGDSFLERPAHEAVAELFESEAGETLVGKRLGPYSISGRLGQGAMGVVYLARDTRLDRTVAIKALPPLYTRDSQYRERLRREARAAARLSHPGIATVYALEEFDDDLYIVSEYVPGRTLLAELDRGPLSLPLLLDVAVQIAHALAAAHERGIVHRDLKPENVIRTAEGAVKILDFGLARFQGAQACDALSAMRLSREGTFVGTPAYASPEQLLCSQLDFRSDIFSFGVLLYELACGKHPFAAPEALSTIARILEAEAPDLVQVNPAIPRELERVIRRCLRKDPAQRYTSTRQLLAELEQIRHAVLFPQGPPAAEKAANGGRRSRLTPLWWWKFHQACAGFGYYLMLYPMWVVKQWTPGYMGSLLFFPALAAVAVAANLRLHLWFTSHFYPAELSKHRCRVSGWLRFGDWLFAAMLAVAAVSIHSAHATIATLLMAVAIGSLVAFALIEPTTARAAFGSDEGSGG